MRHSPSSALSSGPAYRRRLQRSHFVIPADAEAHTFPPIGAAARNLAYIHSAAQNGAICAPYEQRLFRHLFRGRATFWGLVHL